MAHDRQTTDELLRLIWAPAFDERQMEFPASREWAFDRPWLGGFGYEQRLGPEQDPEAPDPQAGHPTPAGHQLGI